MESRKMVLNNLFTGQQWRNRHREQTYGHEERGGEGEMYGKSTMETYITILKIVHFFFFDATGNVMYIYGFKVCKYKACDENPLEQPYPQ